MAVKTYDLALVTVDVGGTLITGFAKDTAAKVEYDEELWKKSVSGDGLNVCRSKMNDYTGTMEFSLKQTADSNTYLTSLVELDRTSASGGKVDVSVKDLSGNSVFSAEGWIKKAPAAEFGVEEKDQTWIIDCGTMEFLLQGN